MSARKKIGALMVTIGLLAAAADWALIYPGITVGIERPGYATFIVLSFCAMLLVLDMPTKRGDKDSA